MTRTRTAPPGRPATLASVRSNGRRPVESAVRVPPGRTWTIASLEGDVARGYLPGWAEEDPSRIGIAPERMRHAVHDVIHREPFDGQLLRLAEGGYGPGEQTWVLSGNIECIPEPGEDEQPVPVVNVHLIEDFWLTGLGPREVAVLAAQLRAQADRLEQEVRPRLVAYRADWAAHQPRSARRRSPRRS